MSGGGAVDDRFALFPLDSDERGTLERIAERGARVTVLPTHHVDADGTMKGFRVLAPGTNAVGSAAFTSTMFFGVSVGECVSNAEHIARLLADSADCQARLEKLVASLASDAATKTTARMQSIPRDTQGVLQDATAVSAVRSNGRRAVDSEHWVPDAPLTLGVYQAHIRAMSGERRHGIFIVCEGGCRRAANEYYNMMLDLGDTATLNEVPDCEETWWLRKASSRARARIMYMAAVALGLTPRGIVDDVHSQDGCKIMTPVCETLTHDVSRVRENQVQILNHAVDTTRVQNGIVVKMHPTEGMWVFRGATRVTTGNNVFGGMFGDPAHCPVFPTHTFETDDKNRPGIFNGVGAARRRFLHFNNAFMQHLQSMGWDRDYGVVELIPIAVVHA